MCIVHPLDLESPAVYVCAQAGCDACLEALLHRHEGLVHVILRRQWRGEVAYVDLLQEGRIGLWQAIMHPVLSVQDSALTHIGAWRFRATPGGRLSVGCGGQWHWRSGEWQRKKQPGRTPYPDL